MRGYFVFCLVSLLIGAGESLPFPFLWPSSFGSSTTTTTTTTHAGPPHPHAHHGHTVGTTVLAQPHSSHLHIRPAAVGSYLANRPLPPLVMGAHHHHHLRPISGHNTHMHVHGGAIAAGATGHRHHYHIHRPHQHHHHPHVSSSLRFHVDPIVHA